MIHRKTERGQALILIALAAIGLFAFAALAIDGSRSFSNKRHAQNTADTSVLAAALAGIRCSPAPCTEAQAFAAAEAAARARATSNGYTHDTVIKGVYSEVYVQRCDEATDDQTGEPLVCEGIDPDPSHEKEYIRVRIVSTIPSTFGRVIGRQTLTSAAEAIARVQGGGSSSIYWPFTGAGMVAVHDGNLDKCLMMNGGGDLQIHGAGININCTHSQAWWMDGNSSLVMDANGKVAGCYYENGSANWDPATDPIDCWQSAFAYTKKFFDDNFPTTEPPPTCSTKGTVASGNPSDYTYGSGTYPSLTVKKGSAVINPGKWGTIMVETGADLKMKQGPYCISGGITVKAGSSLGNQGAGTVQMVLGDDSFLVNGSAGGGSSVDFDDLELYFDDGSYQQNSDKVSFNADRLRVFTTGSGNVDVNAGGTFTSGDAYMYLKDGDIIWNADTTLNLVASKSGKYAGLLIYKPWGSADNLTDFNGSSNVYLEGTFLAPTTKIKYNGGSDWELHSQVIADTFLVNANTDVDIWYVADEQYQPPSSPAATIELTR